ncbi:hypothetical protein OAL10_11640 [Gammaproteobacteria bacterium]|nr:hypothetical protein [Gammaproteobacteria bacterium]
MSKYKVILSWVGIVILGLTHGVLEDLMFIRVIVEYMPVDWDITGDLFFTFTVPLAQLATFAITGTLAWHFLGLWQLPKLITFWGCWVVARTTFLSLLLNPIQDIAIYLTWITLWCVLVGLYAWAKHPQTTAAG